MFYYSPCCKEKMTEDIHNVLICKVCGSRFSKDSWRLSWDSIIKGKKQVAELVEGGGPWG